MRPVMGYSSPPSRVEDEGSWARMSGTHHGVGSVSSSTGPSSSPACASPFRLRSASISSVDT